MRRRVHKGLALLVSLCMVVMLLPMAALALSSDAGLTTVLGQSISATGDGTVGSPKVASIDVGSDVTQVSANDIVAATGATVAFYGMDSTFTTVDEDGVALTAGASTTVYIKVTAEDQQTVVYYALTINKYQIEIGKEADGGTYKTREITITANSLEGKTLVVKLQHGTTDPTTADIHVFTITPQSNVVKVSYNRQLAEIEVWLIEGTPDLTEEDLGTPIYAHAQAN